MSFLLFFFFFNDTATTEIYTLSLHDALPISCRGPLARMVSAGVLGVRHSVAIPKRSSIIEAVNRGRRLVLRSEEHTSELQSRQYLVCRLLLEKKKKLAQIILFAPLITAAPGN